MANLIEKMTGRPGRVIDRAYLDWARDAVFTATAGNPGGGIRVKLNRLQPGQVEELIELTRGVADFSVDSEGKRRYPPLNRKRQHRWENLVEAAADRPGHFEKIRADAKLQADFTELANQMAKPSPRRRWEQPGAVILPAELFDMLDSEILWLDDLLALTYVCGNIERGESLSPAIEVRDGALVVNTRKGFFSGKLDPMGVHTGWKPTVENLERLDLLTVERSGPTWTIRRGAELLRILRERNR